MNAPRPIRVLHVIDGLAAGGSERLLFDVVRLSSERVHHRVTTVYRESSRQMGPFPFAEPLRMLGTYRAKARGGSPSVSAIGAHVRSAIAGGRLESIARFVWTATTVLLPGLYRALREWAAFRPDVIHAHLYYSLPSSLLLSRLTGRPLVHTVPAMIAQMHDVSWVPSFYARFHPWVDRFFAAYPDELRRLGVPERKIRILESTVDIGATEAAYLERTRYRAELRASLGVPADAFLALSVGRLHPSKGHALAARAVATAVGRFPQLQWVVLGEGAERPALETFARELGIGERAHFLGYVSDVLPWYAAADLYLRATTMEAENLSSYQAIAMGLPVVGFDTGAETELMRVVGHGILVPNEDSSRMASAIVELLADPQRLTRLSLRGREYAERELGIARTIEQLITAYQQLGAARTNR